MLLAGAGQGFSFELRWPSSLPLLTSRHFTACPHPPAHAHLQHCKLRWLYARPSSLLLLASQPWRGLPAPPLQLHTHICSIVGWGLSGSSSLDCSFCCRRGSFLSRAMSAHRTPAHTMAAVPAWASACVCALCVW